MNPVVQPEIDWVDWLRRWDAQQEGYVPEREARFSVMLDVLAELLPESFVALDLACGPGSISQRLLARFPAAQAIAVDIDPVMLAIGRAHWLWPEPLARLYRDLSRMLRPGGVFLNGDHMAFDEALPTLRG